MRLLFLLPAFVAAGFVGCIADEPATTSSAPDAGPGATDASEMPSDAGSSIGDSAGEAGKPPYPVATSDASSADAAEGGSASTSRIVFATGAKLLGSGTGGANRFDDACNVEAATGEKTSVKKFRAWVSTNTTDAKDRVMLTGYSGNFVLPDGSTVVARTVQELLGGALTSPINRTAAMTAAPNTQAWTGTEPNGEANAANSGTCGNWLNGGQGQVGSVTAKSSEWTNATFAPCTQPLSVYCFEVP